METRTPASHAENLSGLIERVTFFNEETGFAVLKVKAKGHRELLSVVGTLPSVSPGEWLNAQGHWIQDKEFGLQFRAEGFNVLNHTNFVLATPGQTGEETTHNQFPISTFGQAGGTLNARNLQFGLKLVF